VLETSNSNVQPTWRLPAIDDVLTLVLVSPQIPPNTGNVARLCACTGAKLILIEPLGFDISDKALRRAGLDYWDKVFLKTYASWTDYVSATGEVTRFLFTSKQGNTLWSAQYTKGCHLVFGAETTGLSKEILSSGNGIPTTIPMREELRSLNLSTAVGIATYEALRQIQG
jgi:tRNA (cytidine/uridine-2'-O-)-methyltransferase